MNELTHSAIWRVDNYGVSAIINAPKEMTMNQPKIIAYLKPHCGWSNGVRAVLQKHGLQYEDRDIINNPANYAEMVEKSGQPLSPCVEVNGRMIADVSGDELEQFLIKEGFVKPKAGATAVATNRGCDHH
jgi:monothiol glutaredoxin